jgi:hypothetical protein
MHRPSDRRSAAVALLCALVLPVTLGACSGSTSASDGTTTTVRSATPSTAPSQPSGRSACDLVTRGQIKAITGTVVNPPTVANRGSATTCSYNASDPTNSVIIQFQGGATPNSFAAGQQAFETRFGPTTALSGLGTQAYVGTESTGQGAAVTVVTLVGSAQVVVIGSSSVAQVERLAEQVLSALYAHRGAGPATTAPTSPTSSSSASPSSSTH